MMFLARRFRQIAVVLFASTVAVPVCVRPTPGPGNDTRFVIGSSNTVTADPLVPRPHEKPCIVQLFSDYKFANFNIQSYQFTPPADCPGQWEKVVFTADFNVTAGRQFDRSAIVDLGFVNLYFGTTPEPRRNLAPFWHVERDVTEYSSLFNTAQSGDVILGNLVNSTYTGVISGSAALEFYPKKGDHGRDDPARPADAVYPLMQSNGQGGVNEPAFLHTSTDQLATAFALPRNIERAYLDVITQSQSNDEFWYSCVPNDVAGPLQSCGGTAFREAEVSIDGQPAGVAPVYPWIYTGGIDPFFWEPIPGVQTLNFVPYRVDLTPFAGVLSNGQTHTVALSVFNANNYFAATATLLVYLDHHSEQVTGEVFANTIGSAPNPSINEDLHLDAAGFGTATVTTTSSREFKVEGYVNTSHGRVDTEVHQTVNFNNLQNFTINATTYIQDITQTTQVASRTVTRSGFAFYETTERFSYPLTLNLDLTFFPDGTVTQLGVASLGFKHDILTPFFASSVRNRVDSTDTLDLSSSFSITGNSGQQSSQHYSLFDTRGQAYDCSLTAQNSVLTAASEGCTDTLKVGH
jgi:peptide N-acetyl-beta-D-glucosaminyl asparaginase amidase A